MYGCEEAAILLDAMGFVFIMSCKADRLSYVFSEVHAQILEHGDYGWLARKGLTNTIFAISLWNAPSKKKKYVNWMANFGHPEMFKSGLMCLQQFYVKNMGAVDHVNQGIHLYNFNHKSIKWTNIPFYATISLTAWNASRLVYDRIPHQTYKKVLIEIAHVYGSTPVRKQKLTTFSLKFTKHALSTPFKTHATMAQNGHCVRCFQVDNIKRRISHYCVQCSTNDNISWFCYDCFEWVHSNPKFIKKPLFVTTKPLVMQSPMYNKY